MKRAFLIHGWGGRPDHGFFPWLGVELERRGYAVSIPEMPGSDTPVLERWVPFVEELVGTPDNDTLVVGHSMGGQAALRFLERLPDGLRVGKVILVAPVIDAIMGMSASEEAVARPWLDRRFDWEKIGRSVDAIVGIFSDDDRWIPIESEALVRVLGGGTTTVLSARGHFSGDEACRDLPEILNYL